MRSYVSLKLPYFVFCLPKVGLIIDSHTYKGNLIDNKIYKGCAKYCT